MTDSAIRRALIQQSIAGYSGSCPCPYNSMRNGNSCGGRSAWSRPGGAAPLCYPDDVSDLDVAAYRSEHSETKIEEVRSGKRSSGGGAKSHSSGSSWSSSDWSSSSNGRKRSNRSNSTNDFSSSDLSESQDIAEPVPPTRSLEFRQPSVESEPPPLTPSLKLKEVKVAPEKSATAPARTRTVEPEPQRLPDCPPGTSLARWNNQNICVGTPETLANVTKAEVPTRQYEIGLSGGVENGATQRPMNFADVLSGLQAKAGAGHQPNPEPMAESHRRALSTPATGLLNCAAGTRVTYVDGRIECR
jgi:hypothetical protein